MSMVKYYRLIATSTTCFCSHWFMSEVLECQNAYSADDNVNPVVPGTSSEAEEPKRTKRNCKAIIQRQHGKTWKNRRKP